MPQQCEPSMGLTKCPLAIQFGFPQRSWASAPLAITTTAAPIRGSIRMGCVSKSKGRRSDADRAQRQLDTHDASPSGLNRSTTHRRQRGSRTAASTHRTSPCPEFLSLLTDIEKAELSCAIVDWKTGHKQEGRRG